MLKSTLFTALTVVALATSAVADNPLRGTYVEARTCQVYTGPCFANGEVGLSGKDAIMTWHVTQGQFDGVDLTGLSVGVVVKASHTLGFHGLADSETTKAVLIVDETASDQQAAALQSFAQHQTGLDQQQIAAIHTAGFESDFNQANLTASVRIGRYAHLQTRKARPGDCICSNESAYYPPLTKLEGFVPGVTIDGEVTARRLGTRWSIPDSRTAYLGTFRVDSADTQLARKL